MNKIADPQECANKLIEQANSYGGNDNITVIVADINGFTSKKRKSVKKSRRNAVIISLSAVCIIVAAVIGGFAIINNSAYLVEEEGYISIYKGIPGSFAGIEMSQKEYGSDVWVKDLRESTQEHFKDGIIKVENLDAAWRVLDNYKKEAQDQKDQKSLSNDLNKDTNKKK